MLILYSRPESISTVKSFRNKLKRPNHVPKEYADMVNVFYPITVNMDELKKFVVKGRRPSGKIAIENPNKIIMTCPCCGRKIAVGTNDRMVNHGFQRPGYGWLVGNCIGVNHKPLEVSDEGLRYMVELLTNEHEKLIEKSIKLSTCNSFTVYEFKKYVTYTKGDDFFELKLSNAKRNVESKIDMVNYQLKEFNELIKNWKPNEEAIQIADFVSESTNNSFPPFMREAFNCQEEYDELIGASREIVGSRGLFLAKKKYVIKVYDQDGFSVNKIKSMGSEIKKADTPKIIQKFLKDTVEMILDGIDYDTVCNFVIQQRKTVLKNKLNVFALGVAKQVNNLDKYYAEYLAPGTHATIGANGKKRNLTIPGHARAACNYNVFIIDHDKGARAVVSGDKVLVFYLRQNAYNYNAIAFPAEYERFPSWFNETFSVDLVKTENKMFDNKLAGIFAALGKDVPTLQSVYTNKILGF
jgi:hypothetical protein